MSVPYGLYVPDSNAGIIHFNRRESAKSAGGNVVYSNRNEIIIILEFSLSIELVNMVLSLLSISFMPSDAFISVENLK